MNKSQMSRILATSVACIALVVNVACESEQSKQAKKLFQEAADEEMISGIEPAIDLYEGIVRNFPETKSADLARTKIGAYKTQRESDANLLYQEAEGTSGDKSAVLYRIILERYANTRVASLAEGKIEAYEEAQRRERERQERLERERQARELYQAAEDSSGVKAIALYKKIIKDYSDMEEAKLAPDRIKAEEHAMRLAPDPAHRILLNSQKRVEMPS